MWLDGWKVQLGLAAKSAEELPVGAGVKKPDVSDLRVNKEREEREKQRQFL